MRFTAALLLLTACATTPRPREITAVIEPLVLKHGVPALAAAIARADGPIIVAATGVRSRGALGSIRANSRFHIGAVTKEITAEMLARLNATDVASAERATGKRWEELVRMQVFEPMELRSAGFGWPSKRSPNETWGHIEENGVLVPHDGEPIPAALAPSRDVHMSVDDLARFFRVRLRRGGERVTYSGDERTFTTFVAVDPKRNLVVAVSANAADAGARGAAKAALEELLRRYARAR